MRIYTHIEYLYENGAYKLDPDKSIWYNYFGPIEAVCGATQEQKQSYQDEAGITKLVQQQLGDVFGYSSNVFNDLYSTFSPIVAAGPNQQGFSPAELSNLQSQAITNVGQQYNNAKQAVGERTAAIGGGNVSLPSGAQIAPQLSLASGAAEETSSELNKINQANYQTGRQNWLNAASGLAGAPNTFNAAGNYTSDLIKAGSEQATQANEVAQSDNSWTNALIGAGAQIAGSYVGTLG